MKHKRPIISAAIILNPSLENICKSMIFRYFDINTDKIFDQRREGDTQGWVRDWSEPDERRAHATLVHSQFLTQGCAVFGSSGDTAVQTGVLEAYTYHVS